MEEQIREQLNNFKIKVREAIENLLGENLQSQIEQFKIEIYEDPEIDGKAIIHIIPQTTLGKMVIKDYLNKIETNLGDHFVQ